MSPDDRDLSAHLPQELARALSERRQVEDLMIAEVRGRHEARVAMGEVRDRAVEPPGVRPATPRTDGMLG